MTAQQAIQAKIDAQQTLDAIEYALRACRDGAFGGKIPTPRLREQFEAGRKVAEGICGHAIQLGELGAMRYAKQRAAEDLKAASEAAKAIGTKRQLRLALAA